MGFVDILEVMNLIESANLNLEFTHLYFVLTLTCLFILISTLSKDLLSCCYLDFVSSRSIIVSSYISSNFYDSTEGSNKLSFVTIRRLLIVRLIISVEYSISSVIPFLSTCSPYSLPRDLINC